jgi:hypothetical protein
MSVIRTTATAGPDGVLHIRVPVGAEGEYEVTAVIEPKPPGSGPTKTLEELGWPPGYFENTFGSITDEAFKRYPQGEFEKRESLD